MENAQMTELGTQRSCIRELFEYGKIKAAEVGTENVFDFSLGNPST
ncbi:MAG: pyridoxal phosphate-dependent aminotransferase, partial [Oscillospiraceae bacterium]